MDEANATENTSYDETSGLKKTVPVQINKKQPKDVWFGIFLIFVGMIFLLNTFNIVPWNVWARLVNFWPILLVFGGLSILLGKNILSRIAVALFVGIVLFFISMYVVSDYVPQVKEWSQKNFSWIPRIPINEPIITSANFSTELALRDYPDAKQIAVSLQHGSQSFSLTDENDKNAFFRLDAEYDDVFYAEPQVVGEQEDDVLTVDVITGKPSGLPFNFMKEASYAMILGDTQNKLSEITVDMGSGSGDINVSENQFETFTITLGSGNFTGYFDGNAVPKEVNVDMGSGSIDLTFPSTVNLEVTYKMGSGSLEIDGSSVNGNGVFRTSERSNDDTVMINVTMGSGSLHINRE